MKKVVIKGASVPALGLGTFQLQGDTAYNMVRTAIGEGIYHIDTAQLYQNEASVGKAIRDAAIPRDELFLTTKVWWDRLSADRFMPSVEESLSKLKTDYVDLLLIHWPNPEVPVEQYIEQLVKAQEKGYANHIGLSNHPTALVSKALATGANLITNQVEYHPLLDQTKLHAFLREKGIALTAYSPIAQGKVIGNKVLKAIAEKYSKDEVQVTLRWILQQENVLAIPRTSKKERLASNFNVFDFELTQGEMELINRLNKENTRVVNPSFAPAWD